MANSIDNDRLRKLTLAWPDRAIKILYEHYHGVLVNIAERKTHNRKASEDIVQDVFIQFWTNSRRLCASEKFLILPYLLNCVKWKAINCYHRFERDRIQLPDQASHHSAPETEILQMEATNALRDIVFSLPPRQRQCIVMRFFGEMSIRAISDELGITTKAVEKNITKALKNLRNYRSGIY